MGILNAGYADSVRALMGVKATELSDSDISSPAVAGLAEAMIMKRVPNWASADITDKIFIETAVLNYICYLLAPTMGGRTKVEVSSIDTKWKKGKVDWDSLADKFILNCEECLSRVESVVVDEYEVTIMGIASTEESD